MGKDKSKAGSSKGKKKPAPYSRDHNAASTSSAGASAPPNPVSQVTESLAKRAMKATYDYQEEHGHNPGNPRYRCTLSVTVPQGNGNAASTSWSSTSAFKNKQEAKADACLQAIEKNELEIFLAGHPKGQKPVTKKVLDKIDTFVAKCAGKGIDAVFTQGVGVQGFAEWELKLFAGSYRLYRETSAPRFSNDAFAAKVHIIKRFYEGNYWDTVLKDKAEHEKKQESERQRLAEIAEAQGRSVSEIQWVWKLQDGVCVKVPAE